MIVETIKTSTTSFSAQLDWSKDSSPGDSKDSRVDFQAVENWIQNIISCF